MPKKETAQKPAQGKEQKGKTTGKKVVIEASECTSCGACVEACPEVFALEEGAEAATVTKPTGGPEDLIQKAIDSCPTSCISLTGDAGVPEGGQGGASESQEQKAAAAPGGVDAGR